MNEDISLLTFEDLKGVPVILVLLFLLIKWLAPICIRGEKNLRLFYIGLLLKAIGVILSLLFYTYIEPHGDTHSYFKYGKVISKYISGNRINDYFRLCTTSFDDLPFDLKAQLPLGPFFPKTLEGNKLTILLCGSACYLFFNSYVGVSILFSFFGYLGIWLIFYRLMRLYPSLYFYFFLFIVCWPSIIFFGAGMLKEPLCIGSIGILFYVTFSKDADVLLRLRNIMLAVFSALILLFVKPYLFYSFAIAYLLYRLIYAITGLSSPLVRRGIYLLVFSMLAGSVLYFLLFWEKFMHSRVMEDLYTFILRTTTAQLTLGSSKYDLGKLEMTPGGIFSYLAASLNVSLFRPFVYEINKPQLLVSGLESLVMLLLLLLTLYKVGITNIGRSLKNNPFLVFLMIYFGLVGIQIGAISFNYGALVRYKMPLLPFYFSFFIILLKYKSHQAKPEILI